MPVISIKDWFLQNTSWATTVIFDAASTSGYEASLSTYNWSHTTTASSNRTLLVGVAIFATGTVSSIDYGGQALTFVRSDTNGIYRSEVWRLFAPVSGTKTITVTLSASLTSIANAETYYNSDQTALDGNAGANGTNTPASASITTIVDKCTVFGTLATQTASGVISSTGQSPRKNNNGALGTNMADDFGDVTPAGSKTLSWTGMAALDSWAISLISIRPPQGVRVRRFLSILGAGR